MAFMIGEGLLLHNYRMQRHDSMYVMLIPCMFFLFYLLKSIRGRRLKYVAELSLVVYIIHPLLILLVRMFAKFAEIEELLIYNSLIHFGATCIASVAAACFILRVKHFAAPKKKKQFRRVTAEINTRSLRQNVRILRGWMHEDCKIMAVVKADAYGHGAVPVSCVLNEEGVDAFAVATLEEAVSLRRGGVDGKILILGYTDPCQVRKIRRYRLTQTVVSKEHACRLNQKRTRIDVHIKIDTGMHRVGIDVEQLSAIEKVFHLNYLHVTGMYTHLCVSDSLQENDVNFTLEQICKMDDCIRQLQEKRITIPEVHVQSSSGLYCYPYLSYSYVRAGIALYGVASSLQNAMASATDLKPVMTLKSQIILVKNVPAGETVGYGRNFTAKRDTTVAVVCAGYADGIPRNLSQNGAVLIRGRRAPIVGSICMDQLMADVTDIPEAAVGDDVILFGRDGKEEISAESFAEASGSITNEILSRIGSRVERIYR